MPRYVDKDMFAEDICEFSAIDENTANTVITLLHRQPIADVVPRSEVEELETKLHLAEEAFRVASENAESARDKARELEKQLQQAKQEVARKMCKEIRWFFEEHFYLEKTKKITIDNLHIELSKKYNFESCEVERFIAELSKKYIGE